MTTNVAVNSGHDHKDMHLWQLQLGPLFTQTIPADMLPTILIHLLVICFAFCADKNSNKKMLTHLTIDFQRKDTEVLN